MMFHKVSLKEAADKTGVGKLVAPGTTESKCVAWLGELAGPLPMDEMPCSACWID